MAIADRLEFLAKFKINIILLPHVDLCGADNILTAHFLLKENSKNVIG
jgi:hypothetical protein